MAQPALTLNARPGVLPLWDIDAALGRLPVEVRASLNWTSAAARQALDSLATEPLTDDLINDVTRSFWKPFEAVTRASRKLLATRDAWQTRMEHSLREDAELMNGFLTSDDSRETLAWCLGFFRALFGLISTVDFDRLQQWNEKDIAALSEQPGTLLLMRAEGCLLAALRIARDKRDEERAEELVDVAFLALCEAQDLFRHEGLWLAPFAGETPTERAERTLRYARHVREELSDADAEMMESARMHNLR